MVDNLVGSVGRYQSHSSIRSGSILGGTAILSYTNRMLSSLKGSLLFHLSAKSIPSCGEDYFHSACLSGEVPLLKTLDPAPAPFIPQAVDSKPYSLIECSLLQVQRFMP